MFDVFRLKEALVEYKKRFVQKQWPDEKYKWEAVKCFQLNWNVNAEDFAQMLAKQGDYITCVLLSISLNVSFNSASDSIVHGLVLLLISINSSSFN